MDKKKIIQLNSTAQKKHEKLLSNPCWQLSHKDVEEKFMTLAVTVKTKTFRKWNFPTVCYVRVEGKHSTCWYYMHIAETNKLCKRQRQDK